MFQTEMLWGKPFIALKLIESKVKWFNLSLASHFAAIKQKHRKMVSLCVCAVDGGWIMRFHYFSLLSQTKTN